MNRIKEFQREVDEACKRVNKSSMLQAVPKKSYAEICWDLPQEQFSWSWTKHVTYKGLEKDFIKKVLEGFEVCKKSDATIHLIIGDQEQENGCFIIGKYRNVWLKPTAQSD